MLIGFVLLVAGMALLGYVVTARRPAAAEVPTEAPRLRTHASLGNAILEPLPDSNDLFAQPVEVAAPCLDPRVVVAYEAEATQDECQAAEVQDGAPARARILVAASGDTDRGQRRRMNDDSLLLLPDQCLFAVADGMGGYAGGSVASTLTVEALERAFAHDASHAQLRATSLIPRYGRELASAIADAHQAVFRAARASAQHCKMGTTLVAARFSPSEQRVYIGHVGDSRCYRFRGGGLRQLTTDQTMGTIGLAGPHAEDLLQALGVTLDLSIDLIIDKPQAGDTYLLCSDGLTKMVDDRQIQKILADERDLEAAVYGLIEQANDAGGLDNITVLLVRVIDPAGNEIVTTPSPPPEQKGWTKLPDIAPADSCGFDDETVVGRLGVWSRG